MANQPVKKFKAGAVEAAIWNNEKKSGDKVTNVESVSIVPWASLSLLRGRSLSQARRVSLGANRLCG